MPSPIPFTKFREKQHLRCAIAFVLRTLIQEGSMTSNSVRVASVGIGWWSNVLADAIGKSEELEIVNCYTRHEERRAEFAAKYRCRQAKTYEEVLKDPEVEGVLLTIPHTLHADYAILAAHAGKHVFLEKPFALTTADALKAAAACKQAGVVLAVGHSRRRQAPNRKLKAMLEAKELGVVTQVEGNLSAGSALGYAPDFWRSSRTESPAGGMTAMGVHHVDTFQYLLGPITRVMAISKRLAAPVDLDDTTALIFEFERGPVGYLGTSLVIPKILYLNVYGTEANAYTEGAGASEGEGTRLLIQKVGGDQKVAVPLPPTDIFREELEDFAHAVRGGRAYEVTVEEAIRVVAVCEAVVRSVETGRLVNVSDFL
jgi:predicted dehydrogenase